MCIATGMGDSGDPTDAGKIYWSHLCFVWQQSIDSAWLFVYLVSRCVALNYSLVDPIEWANLFNSTRRWGASYDLNVSSIQIYLRLIERKRWIFRADMGHLIDIGWNISWIWGEFDVGCLAIATVRSFGFNFHSTLVRLWLVSAQLLPIYKKVGRFSPIRSDSGSSIVNFGPILVQFWTNLVNFLRSQI